MLQSVSLKKLVSQSQILDLDDTFLFLFSVWNLGQGNVVKFSLRDQRQSILNIIAFWACFRTNSIKKKCCTCLVSLGYTATDRINIAECLNAHFYMAFLKGNICRLHDRCYFIPWIWMQHIASTDYTYGMYHFKFLLWYFIVNEESGTCIVLFRAYRGQHWKGKQKKKNQKKGMKEIAIRICLPPDSRTCPSISCCIFNKHNFFYKEQNALAFNWDMCCHLALCLQLIIFHCVKLARL